MPKIVTRIVVFLLASALTLDSAMAESFGARPSSPSVHLSSMLMGAASFQAEAFALRVRGMPHSFTAVSTAKQFRTLVPTDSLPPSVSKRRAPLALVFVLGEILVPWVQHWPIWSHGARYRGIPGRAAAAMGGMIEELVYGLLVTPVVIYLMEKYVPDEQSVDLRLLAAMIGIQVIFVWLHSGDTLWMHDGTGRIMPRVANFDDYLYVNVWRVLFAAGYSAAYLVLIEQHVGSAAATLAATLVAVLMHAAYNGLSRRLVAMPSPDILAKLSGPITGLGRVVVRTHSFLMAA